MNQDAAPPSEDESAEVLALIEVLHETGRRLEKLTAGEVERRTSSGGRDHHPDARRRGVRPTGGRREHFQRGTGSAKP